MFTAKFGKYVIPGETITCDTLGFHCVATVHHDADHGEPWKEADGHGPVTDWVRRGKNSGERVLAQDRDSYRYYDFQAAVALAKKDGWGVDGGKRDGETAAQYATRAAEHDYKVLKAWCDDEWSWCGIVVTVYREDVKLGHASLWGIEMNYPDSDNAYLADVANELLPEAITEANATLNKLRAS